MKTKEDIQKDIEDNNQMIISNTDALKNDDSLTTGQIYNLHLANKIIQTRIDTLKWIISSEI